LFTSRILKVFSLTFCGSAANFSRQGSEEFTAGYLPSCGGGVDPRLGLVAGFGTIISMPGFQTGVPNYLFREIHEMNCLKQALVGVNIR